MTKLRHIQQQSPNASALTAMAMVTNLSPRAVEDMARMSVEYVEGFELSPGEVAQVLVHISQVSWEEVELLEPRRLQSYALNIPKRTCVLALRPPNSMILHYVAYLDTDVYDPQRKKAIPVGFYDRGDWNLVAIVHPE